MNHGFIMVHHPSEMAPIYDITPPVGHGLSKGDP